MKTSKFQLEILVIQQIIFSGVRKNCTDYLAHKLLKYVL